MDSIAENTVDSFYRAMLRSKSAIAMASCLSVVFRYCGHMGWNTSKIISRLINLGYLLSAEYRPLA